MAWIVREDSYGEVRLDGLAAVTVVRLQGSILGGHREIGFIRDERAFLHLVKGKSRRYHPGQRYWEDRVMAQKEITGYQNVSYRPDEIKDWRIIGEWWDVCNCDIGCPCEFAATPTMGFCEGVHGWVIREGHFGDVSLENLAAVTIIRYEGNPLNKNREMGFVIDESADARQRRALELIYSGNAGGRFAIWGDLTIRPLGIEFATINISYADDDWFFEIPGKAVARGVPYSGHMVPEGQRCLIINPPRPEAGPGYVTLGEGRELDVDVLGMKFAWPNQSAKQMPFDFVGPRDTKFDKKGPVG